MIDAPGRAFARFLALLALLLAAVPATTRAADPKPGPPLTIAPARGLISIDGDLTDAGWQGIDSVTTWFETRVGDNVEPQVRNVAFLAYDQTYFYAAFRFEDPHPEGIRAPLGDHDAVPSSTDYAGVIVDSRNDGKTAMMFLANARGVQYDAMTSDVSGEDSAPDFYWDCVGKITATGWNLEIRIPFSSLRYANEAQPTWGILLHRNYPRDRRYQFFSARLPRDVSCFICNSSKMTGLGSIPHGSHLVVAPFATSSQASWPRDDQLGNPLDQGHAEWDAGVDVKWNPSASAAIDATVNPDFSQVESDVAQIAANERFALFYSEKRPFFLEGVDLFSTPLNAVYTRTITAPSGGLRATGRLGSNSYTALGTRDDGGGVVILPGPQGSDAAPQDFRSDVGVLRVRHDMGQSFVSVLGTGRVIDDGGYNYVFGPDFQWRPRPSESFTGQLLWSETETPNRPDLTTEWDGHRLSDHAALLYGSHTDAHFDIFVQGQDIGRDFRADNGFIPQVGYRELYFESGWTERPKDRFLSRVRLFTVDWIDTETERDSRILSGRYSVGAGMDGRWNSFTRVEFNQEQFRVGEELLRRFRPRFYFEASPTALFNFFSVDAFVGPEVDFANAREGTGATLLGNLTLRPGDHLELRANYSLRWLDVDVEGLGKGRLFTAQADRLRATYSFSARSFVRLIGQYVVTDREPERYTFAVAEKDAVFSGSALFAYKVNWQTVLYLGYGGQSAFNEPTDQLEKAGNQAFAKISYALQR